MKFESKYKKFSSKECIWNVSSKILLIIFEHLRINLEMAEMPYTISLATCDIVDLTQNLIRWSNCERKKPINLCSHHHCCTRPDITSCKSCIHRLLNWVIIGIDDGLLPVRCQAIIKCNDDISTITPKGTHFNEKNVQNQSTSIDQITFQVIICNFAVLFFQGEGGVKQHPHPH